MSWLLIITLSMGGQTARIAWAHLPDASMCTVTGGAVVLFLRDQTPGLSARFDCVSGARA